MKKLLFITGTRADFGKLKPLMHAVNDVDEYALHVFITGMHMQRKYGMTRIEVEREGFPDTYSFINQGTRDSMDIVLAKTVHGLSDFVKEIQPDLIIVHGDRVETLAGAIVGSMNNILVAHIEGGEVSGTIDELIRHAVTKLSHLHFVCNSTAVRRLLQMGEREDSIVEIGSPDLDVMMSDRLPTLQQSRAKYEIPFETYALLMYHPVTTELPELQAKIHAVVQAALQSGGNFVVVYPNNDLGSEIVLAEIEQLRGNPRFRVFPSINFEHFLVLLRHARFLLGNSSAGIREAPVYGVPSIDVGSRQNGRSNSNSIAQVPEDPERILDVIRTLPKRFEPSLEFGQGDSANRFVDALANPNLWACPTQKRFIDWPM